MRSADGWKDYELIDASDGERLERWGDILLIRPDPQILWQTPRRHPLWKQARYIAATRALQELYVYETEEGA